MDNQEFPEAAIEAGRLPIKRVAVPIDLNVDGRAALDWGLAFCVWPDSVLYVVHAMNPHSPPIRALGIEFQAERLRERLLAQAKDEIAALGSRAEGVDVRVEVLMGAPADRIVNFARRERIDLIVMCRRDRIHMQRGVLGGTSDKVIRMAHCPVFVVPPRTDDVPESGAEG